MTRMWKLTVLTAALMLASIIGLREFGSSISPEKTRAHEDAEHGHGDKSAGEQHAQAPDSDQKGNSDGGHAHPNGDQHGGGGESHESGKEDEEEKTVRLSPAQIQEFKIETEVAAEGPVAIHIERPAEVKFNQNRFAHVVPRVPGIVSRVEVSQGENVKEGQLLAVLESRELADAKANYLAAAERRQLANETFVREERLWKQKVSAENEFLKAKTELAEADISLATAEQKLRTLGLSADAVKGISLSDPRLTEYEIVSPQSGTVTERHLTLGEAVETEREIFVVADVSTVWIDVSIYPTDTVSVKKGQRVDISLGDGDPIVSKIEFVTPEVKEATRTAVARVIVDNASGRLRPGMFVTAQIELAREVAAVRIPKTALQREENADVVYVEQEGAFVPRPVKLGKENHKFVEVVDGLQPGETYVSSGGFVIKAQLGKASFGEGHAH